MKREYFRRPPPEEGPGDQLPTRDVAELKAVALLAKAGIIAPPVDLQECAIAADIAFIRETTMQDTRSALLMQLPGGMATILVNADHRPTRRRFSIAHELGHWVLERAPVTHELRPIAARGRRYDRVERICNYFAACLLMPANWIRDRADAGMTNAELARAFDVSPQALVHRLGELGYYARGGMR